MKSTCLTLLGLLFLAAAQGVRADGPVTPAAPTGFGEADGVLPDFVAIYDVNEDGQISSEERQALRQDRKRSERFRDRWDADKDGKISDAEREVAKERIRLMIEKQRRRRFTNVDTNGDGFLSRAEFAAIPAVQNSDANSPGISSRIFEHMDRAPKDGVVSEREFLSALETPEEPRTKDSDTVDTAPTPPADGADTPTSR